MDYQGDEISEREWGVMEDGAIGSHDFVRTKVTRSNRLSCRTCGKALPMGSRAVFELDGGRFVTVYCTKCADEDETIFIAENSARHPMDLED